MKIVNLTPHALHIRRADGTDITIEPSGIVPRLEVRREACVPVTELRAIAHSVIRWSERTEAALREMAHGK